MPQQPHITTHTTAIKDYNIKQKIIIGNIMGELEAKIGDNGFETRSLSDEK